MSDTPANLNERGEITLELEPGAVYVLRPTFAAIMAIEKATGKALGALHDCAFDASMTLSEAAIIVTECIKAWGADAASGDEPHRVAAPQASVRRVAELIYQMPGGLFVTLRVIRVLLAGAATGGYTPQGNPRKGEAAAAG